MELIDRVVPTDKQITGAIALRCSRVFPALNVANSLAGSETVEWRLLRTFNLVELVKEADARRIDLTGVDCAVEGGKVIGSPLYREARSRAENDLKKESR